jgi:hypothetical protein
VLTNADQTLSTIPIIVNKYEIGFSSTAGKHTVLLKIYYQQLNQLTVYSLQEKYIQLADFFESTTTLNSPVGNYLSAESYGLEESWRYRNEKGLALEINGNIYKSIRGDRSMEARQLNLRPGRFNGKFALNFLASKEFVHEKKGKNRIWNINLRYFTLGGLWEQTIDKVLSAQAEGTVYAEPGNFNQQLANYTRLDFSLSRTIATPKIRWRYALDVQNVLGISNAAFHYYDPFLASVQTQEQLGIIPVLSVQASW